MEYNWTQPEDLDPENFYFYEPDPNRPHFDDYQEYLRNYIIDEELSPSFVEWISLQQNFSTYAHGEKSPIFGRTFQLNLYTENFLKGLFADIINTLSQGKSWLYVHSSTKTVIEVT